jgi:hypothetical protein
MTKWRILHIPSGRYLTKSRPIFYGDFGTSEVEYSLGNYIIDIVYEVIFKISAKRKLNDIFAGTVRVNSELLLLNDNNRCEFEVVRA